MKTFRRFTAKALRRLADIIDAEGPSYFHLMGP